MSGSSLALLEEVAGDDPERHSRWAQDERFCHAMRRAVLRRQEHPPMVGIDTRPGTRKPIVLVR